MNQQDLKPFITASEARRTAETALVSELRPILSDISDAIRAASNQGLCTATIKLPSHQFKLKDSIMCAIRAQGYFVETIRTPSGGSQWDPYPEEHLKISWGVGVNVNKREV